VSFLTLVGVACGDAFGQAFASKTRDQVQQFLKEQGTSLDQLIEAYVAHNTSYLIL
jgi:hypothetical protein